MTSLIRPLGAFALVAFLALSLVAGAGAHVKTPNDRWLFTGSTYSNDDEPPRTENRSDPINVVWRNSSDSNMRVFQALEHTEQHWTERRIPGRFPRGAAMRPRGNPLCTRAQHVFMRRGDAANDGDFAASVSYMSTNGACGHQYHIRMWSSRVHADLFNDNHLDDWVLTPLHHDRAFLRCRGTAPAVVCLPHHRIDLHWDQARLIYYRTMLPHCRDPRWAIHPESQGFRYGDFRSTGVIARIGARHREPDGCEGW